MFSPSATFRAMVIPPQPMHLVIVMSDMSEPPCFVIGYLKESNILAMERGQSWRPF